jgi:putative YphP/YqiW family bacilliredoxin
LDLNARFIQPMRDELTSIGFTELTTPEAVDAALGTPDGATLVFVNSVCGCAAGMARPGMAQALGSTAARPDRLVTVFAGQDARRPRGRAATSPTSRPRRRRSLCSRTARPSRSCRATTSRAATPRTWPRSSSPRSRSIAGRPAPDR